MKTIQILMPMGGLGQRFRDEGYTVPKPLIEVKGKAMFLHALDSFNVYQGDKRHFFVIRQDAEDAYNLATSIKNIQPDAKIAILQHNTQGAVETCLRARDLIDPQLPLIIMDCDFSFTSGDYFAKVADLAERNIYDGVLLSFDSNDGRYSYARLNDAGDVVQTAEKNVISSNALAGAYCFRNGEIFLEAADELLRKSLNNDMNEYFISLLYNILLKQGKKITLAKVEAFNSFGTPQELTAYLARF
jgi:dTDP-glucose pyrophosphorylase